MWADLCYAVRGEILDALVFDWVGGVGGRVRIRAAPITPQAFNAALYAALRKVHRKRGTKGTPVWWSEDDVFAFCRAHDAVHSGEDAWAALLYDSWLGDVPALLARMGFKEPKKHRT